MKVMVCRKCGKEVADDTRFCRFCGAEIKISADNPLQEKLLRLCSPDNFIEPYDGQKVSDSNMLYKQLVVPNLSDSDLYEIADKAVELLGVVVIREKDINKLKDKVNPKNFLNPYNAEKVEKANLYYGIIAGKSKFSVQEFYELSQKIQDDLYVVKEPPKETEAEKRRKILEFKEKAKYMTVSQLKAMNISDPGIALIRHYILKEKQDKEENPASVVLLIILLIGFGIMAYWFFTQK